MDPRYDQLAQILVNYSTAVQPGQNLLIQMAEPEAMPLASAVYRAGIQAGANVEVAFTSTEFEYDLVKYGSAQQLDWTPAVLKYGVDWADAWIGLSAVKNPYALEGLPADRRAKRGRVTGALAFYRVENTRWVGTRVPTEAFAQKARLPLRDAVDFFFNATLRDWEAEAEKWRRVKDVFQAHTQVRIVGRDTDLTFSTQDRVYVLSQGYRNIPDGEFFTAPVEQTVEGHISFDFPGIYQGQPIDGIRLTFKEGRVVEATSANHQDLLDSVLNLDAGARYLGEFGVGWNYGIDRFVYETLFDEKMGGTIHLALGQAYKDNRGTNKSALHWDIVKDLRTEGEIYLDGDKVLENGKFLV